MISKHCTRVFRWIWDASARFRLEAKIIAGLHHKNILLVHASGYSNNLLYMAMELIEGTSLRAMVAEGGSLSTSAALPLLIQICDAMIYAHANKVLHRDLKPDNVLMKPGAPSELPRSSISDWLN
ncbi:MAG: protein kinase [Candidatus Obscuribacterales bacterium]